MITDTNGIEGPVGKENYLALWPVGELLKRTRGYRVSAKHPGHVLIGCDGADTGYAFDTTQDPMPFVELSLSCLEDYRGTVGRTLLEFLSYIHDYHYEPPPHSPWQ